MRRECLGLPGAPCGRLTTGSRCPTCRRAYHRIYGSPAYQRERARLIGQPCELRLPGCTGIATTADHVIPKSRGGARGPLRPACAHCNSSRQDRQTLEPDAPAAEVRRSGESGTAPRAIPAPPVPAGSPTRRMR